MCHLFFNVSMVLTTWRPSFVPSIAFLSFPSFQILPSSFLTVRMANKQELSCPVCYPVFFPPFSSCKEQAGELLCPPILLACFRLSAGRAGRRGARKEVGTNFPPFSQTHAGATALSVSVMASFYWSHNPCLQPLPPGLEGEELGGGGGC